ncbi:MAG: hypothetical protein FWB95_00490 [Treponema sp.]|nr:hypothetical protein [Treponema sp.]
MTYMEENKQSQSTRVPLRLRVCAKFFLLFIFMLVNINLNAQAYRAYLIPGQIYVGDPATLVLSLPASQVSEDIILTKSNYFITEDKFPSHESIDFKRVILERRSTGSRLMIEFTPFAAGVLEMPVIEIGGEYFTGLRVTVNSLLDARSAPALSTAASVLAMPGTAIMIYGTMAAIVFFILSVIWFIFKGKTAIQKWREKWKRRRLFVSIRNAERRLYRAVQKGADKRSVLDKLSDEFRDFLSTLTGDNCRSMTAREFERTFEALEDSLFLGSFFSRCDRMRFSGVNVESSEILHLLDDMRSFVNVKNKEEKK